jgi:hypothetical protein
MQAIFTAVALLSSRLFAPEATIYRAEEACIPADHLQAGGRYRLLPLCDKYYSPAMYILQSSRPRLLKGR